MSTPSLVVLGDSGPAAEPITEVRRPTPPTAITHAIKPKSDPAATPIDASRSGQPKAAINTIAPNSASTASVSGTVAYTPPTEITTSQGVAAGHRRSMSTALGAATASVATSSTDCQCGTCQSPAITAAAAPANGIPAQKGTRTNRGNAPATPSATTPIASDRAGA